MNKLEIVGKINSLQSLGTVDGEGIRYVVFMQGCPLRCGCCHNPDTWDFNGGKTYTPKQIVNKVIRFKEYFSNNGGITVSGGEPLLQAKFVDNLFSLCHQNGINTCLDTSGCIYNDEVDRLLSNTDRVLLDIKYTDSACYSKFVGCDFDAVLKFLNKLNQKRIKTTLRQVVIPTLNDNEDNIFALNEIAKTHKCVDKIELLPFKKICQVKYDQLGIDFAFKHIETPTKEQMDYLNGLIDF